ncbi:MAG TPA: hypothetical protein VFJ17_02035 [Mycobacteriales bacterium]|nr:hypothetical protein [Mycobacteriales bacterium]HET7310084.1 hypothetical protein [Mycobacteriales bacterium]
MEHIVFFPGPDGAPSFRRVASLDDAVRLVEHLRNVENVSEVSVHTLAPVPLSFRPYYRVEVPAAEAGMEAAPAPVPVEPVEAVVPAQPEPVAEQLPVAEPVVEGEPVSNGRRSLGFFAH